MSATTDVPRLHGALEMDDPGRCPPAGLLCRQEPAGDSVDVAAATPDAVPLRAGIGHAPLEDGVHDILIVVSEDGDLVAADHPAPEPLALAEPLAVHQNDAGVEVVVHRVGMHDLGDSVAPSGMPVALLEKRKVPHRGDRVAIQVEVEERGDVGMRDGVRIEIEDAPLDESGKQEQSKAGLRRRAARRDRVKGVGDVVPDQLRVRQRPTGRFRQLPSGFGQCVPEQMHSDRAEGVTNSRHHRDQSWPQNAHVGREGDLDPVHGLIIRIGL